MSPQKAVALFALFFLSVAPLAGQGAKCPRITGISHMALYVKDMDKSRAYYKDFLGYPQAFKDGSTNPAYFKINDRQWLELYPEQKSGTDRLKHIGLQTDDAEAMRAYLAARGIAAPAKVAIGRLGNVYFSVSDPDGHTVEFVQYKPDSVNVLDKGKIVPDTRSSERLVHIGITVTSLGKALKFYGDTLGCTELWRGNPPKGETLAYVQMKLPDSDDYVQFMLIKDTPTLARLGSYHHMCLEVPDMAKTKALLAARPAVKMLSKGLNSIVASNNRRAMNVLDPDGTRVEFMEAQTVDGKPPASSKLPPPIP